MYIGSLVVFPDDVVSAAVSGHVAIESPLAARYFGEQPLGSARRDAVERVVAAHEARNPAFLTNQKNKQMERGEFF